MNNKKYINNTYIILLDKSKSISVYDMISEILYEAEKNKIISKNDIDLFLIVLNSISELQTKNKKNKTNKIIYSFILFIMRNIILPFIIHENTIYILNTIKHYLHI